MNNPMLCCGDCLEILPEIASESIDLILIDPPYGKTDISWDRVFDFGEMWRQNERVIKPTGAIVIFGMEPFSSRLRLSNIRLYKYDWIWEKTRALGFMNAKNKPLNGHELISVFSKGTCANRSSKRMTYNPQGLIRVDKVVNGLKDCKANDHGHRFARPSHSSTHLQTFTNYPTQILRFGSEAKPVHPTQKPVDLLEYMIRTYTDDDGVVLDYCMGSGSTGVAAVNTGRKFIGIELDPDYFKIAERRIFDAIVNRGDQS